MSSRSTWFWLGLATGLFIFIFFVERKWTPPAPSADLFAPLLANYKADEVTGLEVWRGGKRIALSRETNVWQMTAPIRYPAQPVIIDDLLQAVGKLDRQNRIASTRLEDFGLTQPEALLVLSQGPRRWELHVGSITPSGDQVYVRVNGVDGVFTGSSTLINRLIPSNPNVLRSPVLLTSLSGSLAFDRFEIRSTSRGAGFALNYNSLNRQWRLSKPMQARADKAKTDQLILLAMQARTVEFITDDPSVDLDAFGLNSPETELALGLGTNDVLVVQFGKSPTNNPGLVYARRMSHTNVVLVRRDLVDTLRTPYTQVRDRHLFAFNPAVVHQVEITGGENITLRRQTNNNWRVTTPREFAADQGLARDFLGDLIAWEVADFEWDVVTDFSTFGLAQPHRTVVLRSSTTNGTDLSKTVLDQVFISTNVNGKFYARRADETSVYLIREADTYKIPEHGWHFRDRRIWSYAPDNVVRLTFIQGVQSFEYFRNGTNDWTKSATTQKVPNEFALEEISFLFADFFAVYWMDNGEGARARNNITEGISRIQIEVKDGERTQTYSVDFAPAQGTKPPLAAITLDGQPWIFEFPWKLYQIIAGEFLSDKPPLPKRNP